MDESRAVGNKDELCGRRGQEKNRRGYSETRILNVGSVSFDWVVEENGSKILNQ